MRLPESRTAFSSLLGSLMQSQSMPEVVRDYCAGDIIFDEGDPGDGLYLILEGSVLITAHIGQSRDQSLNEMHAGDFFGEMAIVNDATRSASAVAKTQARVQFVSRPQMMDLLEQSPPLVLALLRAFSHRMREFTRLYVQETVEAERVALMGRFTRSIVHDLKNPLSIIMLASDAVASPNASNDLRRHAKERIQQQVNRLNDMLNELLWVSEGAPIHAFEAVNFATYIDTVVGKVRNELAEPNVIVEFENLPPSVELLLNPRRLDHVFFNLFGNAAEAMPGGGKFILRFQQVANEILVELEDSGPGFAPEVVGKLFTPFFTQGKANGTGLGLTICKNIIEDHGGRIWPRVEPARGAIFIFTLPIKR